MRDVKYAHKIYYDTITVTSVHATIVTCSVSNGITFTHCSVIVSKHTEFCPDIAEFCLVKYFSASFITLIMHIH